MSDNRCAARIRGHQCAKLIGHEGDHHDPVTGSRWGGTDSDLGTHPAAEPTVPLAEHQRAQVERDEAQAQAAAMRRALSDAEVTGSWDDNDQKAWVCELCAVLAATPEQITHAAGCALSSSAGAALLEEVEGLRRENVEQAARLRAMEKALEGAQTLERGDEDEPARVVLDSIDAALAEPGPSGWGRAALDRALAESADLRARLERAEERARLGWERAAEKDRAYGEALRERDEAREDAALAWNGLVPHRPPYLASPAEVRRAVEEEREACAVVAASNGHSGGHPYERGMNYAASIIASAIRARGKE